MSFLRLDASKRRMGFGPRGFDVSKSDTSPAIISCVDPWTSPTIASSECISLAVRIASLLTRIFFWLSFSALLSFVYRSLPSISPH